MTLPVEHRLRLGEHLLELDGRLVTVLAPRWEPGLFVKHVETCDIAIEDDARGGPVVRVSSVGGPTPWEVLRIPVPDDRRTDVEAFAAAVANARAGSCGAIASAARPEPLA